MEVKLGECDLSPNLCYFRERLLSLGSAIHAAIGTHRYNDRIIAEYESQQHAGAFRLRGVSYLPLVTGHGVAHTVCALWSF